ncbi:MAG TPA: flagellar basal-body MS-ring/collar protein FliF [Balneolaceae bacterium]|nr:flagellar basal-body MS-ring/collar protein FliF [Balneolaceae bacterium]
MARYIAAFKNFFSPLSGAQKALFGLFSLGIILIMGLMFYWALQPSYAMLFGSLSPDSANEIVEELRSQGVPYELRDNGKTIAVPRSQVYDLRLQFAAQGVTGSEYKGYELFDENSLGMTDFMQRLNQKRALEGELARTINNLDQVDGSRIHIVLPERSPFQETTVQPSASVILNLNRGRKLAKDQIEGIGSLIAGSVEGLTIDNVVILDHLGNRISENVLVSSEVSASSAQIRVRQDMETYLTNKGQSMLDRVLGPGNSILRISTEHNFDKVLREMDLIDPESRTIISEERRTTRNTDESRETIRANEEVEPFVRNNREDESTVQVRNYEVNKTREQQEKGVGEITRISASILLDHKQVVGTGETNEISYEPYSDAEINEIQRVMSSAIGIDPARGDEVVVTQLRFQDPFADDTGTGGWLMQNLPISDIVRYLFLSVVMIVIAVMVFRMTKNFSVELDPLIAGSDKPEKSLKEGDKGKYLEGETAEEEDDIYGKKLSDEARRKLKRATQRTEEINSFVDESAAEAAALLRTMINQRTA